MGLPCPLGISRVGPARKSFLFGQIIHSLFGPSLFRQMAAYWPDSFLLFMNVDFVSVRKNAKRARPISSHLDLTLSHCYYATLKISRGELPYEMLIVSLWVFGMESRYIYPLRYRSVPCIKKKKFTKNALTLTKQKSLLGVSLSLSHTLIGLPLGFNLNFRMSIPGTFIWIPPPEKDTSFEQIDL